MNGNGTTAPVPNISVSGNGAFGDVEVASSSSHTVTISNTGSANLVMGTLSGLVSPFSMVSNGCSGATVAPSASCTVDVRFSPTTSGARSDTLVIPSNDPDQPNVNFGVNGNGTTAPVQEVVIITDNFENGNANGWTLNGDIAVDSTEAIGQYSLRHTKSGDSELSGSTAGYSGVSVTMNLAATSLENGDDCYAEVSTNNGGSWLSVVHVGNGNDNGNFQSGTVTPSGADNNSNLKLRFRSTGKKKPDHCWGDEVTVRGTPDGSPGEPDISVSGNGAFGDVKVGSNSTRTVTISNVGDANLVMGSLSGLAAPFSIVSNGCSGATVAPSASCTVGVRFAPTTTGSRSDTLNIPSNDPDEAIVDFNVNGNGTDAPVLEEEILNEGFEDGNADGWVLEGSIGIDGILALGNYSLRHTKSGTSGLSVSTIGYSDVSVTMNLAATSLDNGENCYAEISTNGGISWITVVELNSGDNDGGFNSGTVSVSSADDIPDLQLRFRSTGGKKPDYCYGDNVIVSGFLN